MNEELKPCPFCKGIKLKIDCKSTYGRETYSVRCNKCHARGGTYGISRASSSFEELKKRRKDAEQKAIEAWNTRKPIDEIVEQLEIEKNDYEKRYHEDVLKYNNVVHNATMQGNIHGLHIAIEIVKGSAE